MKDIDIPCRSCLGSGRQWLPTVYQTTIEAVGNSWTLTSEIHRKLGLRNVKLTALCNRLDWLLRAGLVQKRQDPKNFRRLEWRVK